MTYGRDQGRRGYRDPRSRSPDDDRSGRRSFMSDRDYGRYESNPRFRDEGYRRPYTGRFAGRQQFGGDYGPERGSHSDRWDRGQTQQSSQQSGQRDFTGTASGLYDRDYSNWRSRQIDDLDRDYDEFRRENSSRFENEFTNWRGQRQAKRGLLGQVTEHMDVVGSDNEPVGKVDYVKGDKVILTKSDSADGRHHVIGCSRIDRVEKDKLILDQTAAELTQQFEQEKRSRALFEREDQSEDGPHMLNRSFSGTY